MKYYYILFLKVRVQGFKKWSPHTHTHTHALGGRTSTSALLHFVWMDGNQSQVSLCPIVCWEVFVRASVAQTFSSVSLTLNWSVQTGCNKTLPSLPHTNTQQHSRKHALKGKGRERRETPEKRNSSSLFLLLLFDIDDRKRPRKPQTHFKRLLRFWSFSWFYKPLSQRGSFGNEQTLSIWASYCI